MLTDPQARALLHDAAETIDVAPTGPLEVRSRRSWRPVAAATAAAVAVVAVGLTVMTDGGDGREWVPQPAAPFVEDGRFQLGPDQMPSVFGYSAEEAVAMLDERGFQVTVVDVPHCGDRGRAVGSVPNTGTLVTAGAEVTVHRSQGTHPYASCVYPADHSDRSDAWGLFDLVGGRDTTDLAFADEVVAYDGDVATKLPASDLASWAPLVAVVREMSEVQRSGGHFRFPYLTTQWGTTKECGEPRPAELRDRQGLAVSTRAPNGSGGSIFQCQYVVLFYDDQRAIDAIRIVDPLGDPGPLTPPPVVGNSAAFATERLQALGYTVEVIERVDCAQPGLVTAQWPSSNLDDSGSVTTAQIAVTTTRGPCSRRQLLGPAGRS